ARCPVERLTSGRTGLLSTRQSTRICPRINHFTIPFLRLSMKKLLVALALVITAPLALGGGAADETRFTLRDELLRLINRDRKQFGLSAVQLDPFASVIADNYCNLQIRNGTSGHFTVDGQAPYMRYSFAGGNDVVSE